MEINDADNKEKEDFVRFAIKWGIASDKAETVFVRLREAGLSGPGVADLRRLRLVDGLRLQRGREGDRRLDDPEYQRIGENSSRGLSFVLPNPVQYILP